MSIFSIDFFIFGGHEDLEVTSSLPLLLVKFDFSDLFFEDSITDDVSQQSLANILILFGFIHKISEEDGEVDDVEEESLHGHLEYLLVDIDFLHEVDLIISLNQLFRVDVIVCFIREVL